MSGRGKRIPVYEEGIIVAGYGDLGGTTRVRRGTDSSYQSGAGSHIDEAIPGPVTGRKIAANIFLGFLTWIGIILLLGIIGIASAMMIFVFFLNYVV